MTVLLSGPARDLSVHSFHFRDTTGHAAVDAMTAGGWQRLLISAAASANASRAFRVDDSCPLAVLISLFSPDMLVSSPAVQRPLSARAPCLAVGSSGGRLRVRGLRRSRSPHNIARVEVFLFSSGGLGGRHCGVLTARLVNSSAKCDEAAFNVVQDETESRTG